MLLQFLNLVHVAFNAVYLQWLLEVQWFKFSTIFRMNTGSSVQLCKKMQTIFYMNVRRITNARNDLNDNRFASKWRLARLYSVMKASEKAWIHWKNANVSTQFIGTISLWNPFLFQLMQFTYDRKGVKSLLFFGIMFIFWFSVIGSWISSWIKRFYFAKVIQKIQISSISYRKTTGNMWITSDFRVIRFETQIQCHTIQYNTIQCNSMECCLHRTNRWLVK